MHQHIESLLVDMETQKMERPESVRMLVNIPAPIRTWMEQVAESDDRTLNSIVVRALREQMQQQAEKAVRQ
jgi:hypothetical protein